MKRIHGVTGIAQVMTLTGVSLLLAGERGVI